MTRGSSARSAGRSSPSWTPTTGRSCWGGGWGGGSGGLGQDGRWGPGEGRGGGRGGGGTGWVEGEGWETVSAALDPLAAPRPADADGQRDERSYARRQADALIELADRSLRVGDLPEQGGERPTVVVTIPY